jgi:hypothetical protein
MVMQKVQESPGEYHPDQGIRTFAEETWQPEPRVGKIADLIDSVQDETTVQGKVRLLGDFPPNLFRLCRGMKQSGVILNTEVDSITVHLGPPWFYCQNNFPIRVGDTLEVIGSRMISQDRQAIVLAREIRINGRSLRLRDKNGAPLWE